MLTAHERLGKKTENIIPIRKYKTRSVPLKPGNRQWHGSRPNLDQRVWPGARTSTNVFGRASGVDYSAFHRKALLIVRRDMFEKVQKNHIILIKRAKHV